MKVSLFISTIFLFFSCQNGNISTEPAVSETSGPDFLTFSVQSDVVTTGKEIDFQWSINEPGLKTDSIVLFVDNERYEKIDTAKKSLSIASTKFLIGKRTISLKAYSQKGTNQKSFIVTIVSDIEPVNYKVKVLKTFSHSRESYTQGLIYRDGIFYESAGEYGHSALKKVELKTGEILAQAANESNIFAEGIAIKNQEIYQISWREQVCLVYNLSTFQQIGRFSYDIREGWGLEYNGKNFLMTDGSNIVYVLDENNFSIIRKIEVMDQNGPVTHLNELELVDNLLYANVYTKDYLVIIDINSGKVVGKIDASELLPQNERREDTDVLNGIAYNPKSKTFYLTGKKWPKLYEVTFISVKK